MKWCYERDHQELNEGRKAEISVMFRIKKMFQCVGISIIYLCG